MELWIKREVLSDGSFVFNVHVPHMFIPARDEGAAQRIANAIADAVNADGVGDDVQIKVNYWGIA